LGTQIGTSGWYCVYNGTGSSVNLSGLVPNTTFRVTVVEYNTVSGGQYYLTTGLSPASVTTVNGPAFSYNNGRFFLGAPAALAPTGVLAAPAAYSSSSTLIASTPVETGRSTNLLLNLLVDGAGDVFYYYEQGTYYLLRGKAIVTVTYLAFEIPIGGPVIDFNIPLSGILTEAVDPAGNLFIEYGGQLIRPGLPSIPFVVNGNSLAADGAGNIYFNNSLADQTAVYELTAGATTPNPTPLTSGQFNIGSIASDPAGNLFVTDGADSVYKIAAGTNVAVAYGTPDNGGINNLGADASGNVYVADAGSIYLELTDGSTVIVEQRQAFTPLAAGVDNYGNVYTYDAGNNGRKFTPTGGYYISPELPAGLIFNSNTGAISGTPTVTSPPTNYSVIGYNASGESYTTTVTIGVSAPSGLSNLSISAGALSPAFAAATGSYTASAGNAATTTVTPTTTDPATTVTVNGAQVISGTASRPISLTPGAVTTIPVVVTAHDGITIIGQYSVAVGMAGGTLSNILGADEVTNSLISDLNSGKVVANNILSPNGDGVNDTWIIKNIEFYPNNKVTVYDQAGNIVYTKQGYTNNWAGTYQGNILNQGTYYYLVDLGKGKKMTGFITVVRDR